MLRQPLTRALALSPSRVAPSTARKYAGQVQAQPEKVEVFIDDKPVYVPPGTTVLQVQRNIMLLGCSMLLGFIWIKMLFLPLYLKD